MNNDVKVVCRMSNKKKEKARKLNKEALKKLAETIIKA